jgi:exo-1,4-beta-D-glucosaminidase
LITGGRAIPRPRVAGQLRLLISSLIWHLYDYYLRPGGEYFGAKKACEPLHPLYSYDDRSVWVVNSSYQDVQKLRLTMRVYNLDFTEKYSQQAMLDDVR